ncbi:psbP domain-containing protein 1, chloroplastic isoform X1 [Rhododendron vialii]|uniref:psbP domain-containing protein 1, chloroplastic isoform X1 n=1 Tax=Rhododendron vialii TaxID=182163 RepID=UPI00265FD2BD|nr:psbP domain-containing protein 1, chloroplastic isoform X1 [Rhododendron vialii]
MAAVLELLPPPPLSAAGHRLTMASPSPGVASPSHWLTAFRNSRGSCRRRRPSFSCKAQTVSVLGIRFMSCKLPFLVYLPTSPWSTAFSHMRWLLTEYFLLYDQTKDFAISRRNAATLIFSSYILSRVDLHDTAIAQQLVELREYIDTFDGYSFKYPRNWIEVRGAGADVFFRDPFVLDENISVEFSSPSSSSYKSVEDLGSPEDAAKKVLKQYLTEFMSTRLGVRRESSILSTSSRVADDGKMYYQVEVNIKSYANNNELAVMPKDRVARLEWDRRYLSVLGVENKQLYELRLQTPENVFEEEETDLRRVMDSFRVNKIAG